MSDDALRFRADDYASRRHTRADTTLMPARCYAFHAYAISIICRYYAAIITLLRQRQRCHDAIYDAASAEMY